MASSGAEPGEGPVSGVHTGTEPLGEQPVSKEPTGGRIVAGLMSGTSLDGISAAVARFHTDDTGRVRHELLSFVQLDYQPDQRERLLRALEGGTAAEYCRLGFDLGEWLADAAARVVAESGLSMAEVDAISSHGQTVWHEAPHSTWQMGESAVIAERTGRPVISDLRVRDVAAGGQGAPLVPMADRLLYSSPTGWRLLQNLGGIGNVSVVQPGGEGVARAFDTGPGVCIMDAVVRRLAGVPYDMDGRLAAAGQPVDEVVAELLGERYFLAEPPKSTGRELFDSAYVDRFLSLVTAARPSAPTEDTVATAVSLTARSIGDQYHRFIAEPAEDVVLSGGGAMNPSLVRAITEAVAPLRVARFDEIFYNGEAKEAVAFALLGWLHLEGQAGNVPSATGAAGPRILGKYTPA